MRGRPVIMTTLSFTLGPAESPATRLILGMFSKVPSSGMPSFSCLLRPSRRTRALADILRELN
jgi:hypothetical protein